MCGVFSSRCRYMQRIFFSPCSSFMNSTWASHHFLIARLFHFLDLRQKVLDSQSIKIRQQSLHLFLFYCQQFCTLAKNFQLRLNNFLAQTVIYCDEILRDQRWESHAFCMCDFLLILGLPLTCVFYSYYAVHGIPAFGFFLFCIYLMPLFGVVKIPPFRVELTPPFSLRSQRSTLRVGSPGGTNTKYQNTNSLPNIKKAAYWQLYFKFGLFKNLFFTFGVLASQVLPSLFKCRE